MHPVLFQCGPVTLYSYGLMVAIGLFAAMSFARARSHAAGLPPSSVQSLILFAFLGGIVGARAAYLILNWSDFAASPIEIIRLDHGGLVFYGGLAGGLITLFFSMCRLHLPYWKTLDLLAPPLVLAHAIGRIGCFLNGCCYGKRIGGFQHPTQLYEAGALVVLLALLLKMEKRGLKPGNLSLTYGFLYGLWRFGVEFLRADSSLVAGGLTNFQWASLALVAGCGILLAIRRRVSGSTSI